MSHELPPCDHDECPPSHCKRPPAAVPEPHNWQACGHHMSLWNGRYCERCCELADQNDIEFDTRNRLLGL